MNCEKNWRSSTHRCPPLSRALVIREEAPGARRTCSNAATTVVRAKSSRRVCPPFYILSVSRAKPSRLDLAQWIVSPENPLTARVTVNRIWQQYFGRGLVKTSENFGSQGEAPSHPELLDWLAAEFVDSGWRLKHMHRLIVTSATYRQSSKIRPDLLSRDPGNALLARQSRVRLPAELIRDGALAASGLLDRSIGGPSAVEGYRRGMYMRLFRNKPHPFLANFDAPNGYAPVCRRTQSTTPLAGFESS